MSLPEEESELAEDDEEWCWGLGRKTGEGDGESALRGEEESLWSSTETSISLAKSCSQDSISVTKQKHKRSGRQVWTDLTTPPVVRDGITIWLFWSQHKIQIGAKCYRKEMRSWAYHDSPTWHTAWPPTSWSSTPCKPAPPGWLWWCGLMYCNRGVGGVGYPWCYQDKL